MLAARIVVTVLLLVFVGSCSEEEHPTEIEIEFTGKPWTVMFYCAGDFYGGGWNALEEWTSEDSVSSGENVDLLFLQDMYDETAKLWYVDEQRTPVLLEERGEINTGEAEELSYFLNYAKDHYPARRYILAFYGHGDAWGGACHDETPSNGVLRMDEIQLALTETGGVDLVLFAGNCRMGALESAYELRNCTDVYIGSENVSHPGFWHYTMTDIFEILHGDPGIDEHELAEDIIQLIWEDRGRWADYPVSDRELTMSAVRTDRITALKDAADSLAGTYLHDPDRFRTLVDSVRDRITSYWDKTWTPDLGSVIGNLFTVETDRDIQLQLLDVQQRLLESVIAECHGENYSDTHGLTVFLPDGDSIVLYQLYTDETIVDDPLGLDFVLDSRWDELLHAAYGSSITSQEAKDALLSSFMNGTPCPPLIDFCVGP